MNLILEVITLIILIITLPGTLYLLLLSLAGSLPVRQLKQTSILPGNFAIVVPAHNESQGISRTLVNLLALAKLDGNTEVVVIADNCNDNTAEIALACGARVLQRSNPELRGKGYALDFAFTALQQENFSAYVVVDADSLIDDNFISTLRMHFGSGAQVLQTRYTVLNHNENPSTCLAEIALAAFNVLRPRGRARLGLSAGILGNGFALRREVLEHVPYTATSVVEDLEYHLSLIEHGYRVEFVDSTHVRGEMPSGKNGQQVQRSRWEGGRIRMLINHAPMFAKKMLAGKWRFIEPSLELVLLPLSYHVLLLSISFLFASWELNTLVMYTLIFSFATIVLHIGLAMYVSRLPLRRLSFIRHIPAYLIWKITMITNTLRNARRDGKWVRTNRNGL